MQAGQFPNAELSLRIRTAAFLARNPGLLSDHHHNDVDGQRKRNHAADESTLHAVGSFLGVLIDSQAD